MKIKISKRFSHEFLAVNRIIYMCRGKPFHKRNSFMLRQCAKLASFDGKCICRILGWFQIYFKVLITHIMHNFKLLIIHLPHSLKILYTTLKLPSCTASTFICILSLPSFHYFYLIFRIQIRPCPISSSSHALFPVIFPLLFSQFIYHCIILS